jgi:hypothetical protein
VKNHWVEIIAIWALVAVSSWVLMVRSPAPWHTPEIAFGTILAGAVALVSLIQLFRAQPQGFVKRLVYVAGGSYLILAIDTLVLSLAG